MADVQTGLDIAGALRGAAWAGNAETPYPRADPADTRIPRDTWATAVIPVGVRLELTGDAGAIEIDYSCGTDDLGYRGEGAGTHFSAWRADAELASAPASPAGGTVRLELDADPDRQQSGGVITVYLPEGLRPTLTAVRGIGGTLAAAAPGPRWLAYGDSITEGWVASGPPHNWVAIASRRWGLDVVNLGYAGSARGEIACAEQIAALPADVISIAHGTNCWSRTVVSREQFREELRSFFRTVRQGHPHTPVVAISPIIRPEAEDTENRLGATLVALRAEFEVLVTGLQDGGDVNLHLVRGLPLLEARHLADPVHPGQEGHAILAEAIGPVVRDAVLPTPGGPSL